MIKTLLFILMLVFFNLSFAQTEKEIDKNSAAVFKEKFNLADFNGIFDLFADEMRNALPKNETNTFLSNLQKQAGHLKNMEFINYVRGTFASYKSTFENGIFALNISTDAQSQINGLFIEPFQENKVPLPERNSATLILPFKEKWNVTWGGDTAALNYHVESKAQKNAFDFLIKGKNGNSYKTDGKTNEDYYAFAKEIIAPCSAEVVLAVDGINDNVPGELNPIYVPGNTVILKTGLSEYLFFAHFKQNSVQVKLGQKVEKGTVLGLCGNSGNSSEPHLHFHIQNVKDMNVATGIKCYFDKISVNGDIKTDYSPIKGDQIENLK